MTDIFAELKWRGLIHQTTDDAGLPGWLAGQPRTLYAGFDPTADSLHVGHLVALLILRRFQRAGHRPIALVGGATGMIGDPSGKSEERVLLTADTINRNVEAMQQQMQRLLDFEPGPHAARLVNNYEWMRGWSYLDFLRDIGKNFPVNVMLAKDSVRSRLENSDVGLSYTEFSYMLLQAYDLVKLNELFACELQVGGSDQWGNITAGIDLARRMGHGQLYGMTCPLLLKKDGTKMGKTEKGALWLSPERTSPYEFYQYWINVDDADVSLCLKMLTELSREEIESLDVARAADPGRRESQKRLAEELTRMIHGHDGLAKAQEASQSLFKADIDSLTAEQLGQAFSNAPSCEITRDRLQGEGLLLIDALVECKLCKSKSDARRVIEDGGAYVNQQVVETIERRLTEEELVAGTTIVLRRGKKNNALLKVVG
jgi:tyrosyl-tRNA synthetase